MIRYKLYQDNRKNSTTRGQWYGRAAVMGVTNLETLAARIQRNCTAKKSDVLAVLTELVEVMQDELQEGRRVKLDGFGSFKIGLSTKGAEARRLRQLQDRTEHQGCGDRQGVHADQERQGCARAVPAGSEDQCRRHACQDFPHWHPGGRVRRVRQAGRGGAAVG